MQLKIAALHAAQNDWQKAAEGYRVALATVETLVPEGTSDTAIRRRDVASVTELLGDALRYDGLGREAMQAYLASKKAFADPPNGEQTNVEPAILDEKSADLRTSDGNHRGASVTYQSSLTHWQSQLADTAVGDPSTLRKVAGLEVKIGRAEVQTGREHSAVSARPMRSLPNWPPLRRAMKICSSSWQ